MSNASHPSARSEPICLRECMGRYADGDPSAFEMLYRILAPGVRARLKRLVGDDELAEDLLQQTFIRVHERRARYERGAAVRPWVFTIARHLAIDALRRRSSARDRVTLEGRLPEPDTVDRLEFDDASGDLDVEQLVRDAVAALPEGQREVVALHKLEGQPLTEVARRLGIKEGAARVRAHRGYGRLRAALGVLLGRTPAPIAI